MGMNIDEAINTLEYIKNNPTNDVDAQLLPEAIELFDTAIDTMRKYQQLQADYEARLKAYMVAMLEDLKQDFIAEAYGIEMDCSDYVVNVADIDKAIQEKINELKQEPTTKNNLGVDLISREQAKTAIRDKFKDLSSRVEINTILNELPSVTPQLSSELEKNSKKLEKNFGELDCISRAEVLKLMKDNWHTHNGDWAMQESMDDIRALPSVTPQEPKTGHWIDKQHLLSSCSAECSSCHKRSNGYVFDNGFSLESEYYDFCPNCGAKMESEVEDGKND